jgi:hypothetical protein
MCRIDRRETLKGNFLEFSTVKLQIKNEILPLFFSRPEGHCVLKCHDVCNRSKVVVIFVLNFKNRKV